MKKLKAAWEKFKQTKFHRTLKEYVGLDDLIAVIITLIGALFYYKNGFLPFHEGWHAFYERIHVELIGIGITVLILGNANQYIQIRQEKRRLILQMGSPNNAFAIEAVRQIRTNGWLFDGTTKRVYLSLSNLTGVDFSFADLEQGNFSWSNLKVALLRKAHLEKANFWGTHLEESDLREAHLEGADLLNVFLEKADLMRSYLEDSNLQGADLRRTDLSETHMQRAHLEGANLSSALLERANLRKITYDKTTIWTGAIYTKTTQWPEGFDPIAAGCILVEDE